MILWLAKLVCRAFGCRARDEWRVAINSVTGEFIERRMVRACPRCKWFSPYAPGMHRRSALD